MAGKNKAASSYRLSTQDSTFIYGESNNGPLHIGSVSMFQGRIDFHGLLGHIEERIHLIPRYRQRLAEVPFNVAHPMMEDDPEFSVERHAIRHELDDGLTEAEAFAEMMEVFQKPLDRARPLWEIHSYENMPGNRTAILWKVHHCLVDGVSGVELLKVMYDFRAEPEDIPQPSQPWVAAAPSSSIRRFAEAVRDQISTTVNSTITAAVQAIEEPAAVAERARMLGEAMRLMTELMTRRIVATPWNSTPVTQERAVAWSKQSFADFRAIRSAFGGSVNDVVLTMLTEGAARYLAHHGYAVEGQQLCIGCPVNVRHREERGALGNRVSMMFPTAPAAPMDVVERLKLIHEETERIKSAGLAQALETVMTLGDAIPPGLIGPASRAAMLAMDAAGAFAKWSRWTPNPNGFNLPPIGINFIATNVPGVQVQQYLNGHLCLDMIPLIPLGATMGYGVAIVSYFRNLYFGMMGEPRVMPDVALMKEFVDEAFAELKERCADASQATVAQMKGSESANA
ncbi:MAG: wax ester/triacylglycerol synthase family O-acyltransferase [Candidatus Binatus sp.]|uniref:wax ester/triacylglycerol synthase family O-acyltransferase n=1 Tax=Candidatus Binatus sp. TaxID=2811406 RepID=UPI002723AA90|nr:wax ester/triacylglycerol synthase family O-acyltransferase [Candidatus Binatus sp.]MDO8434585.1 wax ester/triacylglycerol synthase family O-acyltransferase [Candidatus Binatus sp.]